VLRRSAAAPTRSPTSPTTRASPSTTRHRNLRRRDPAHRALHRHPNDAYDTAAIHLTGYQK